MVPYLLLHPFGPFRCLHDCDGCCLDLAMQPYFRSMGQEHESDLHQLDEELVCQCRLFHRYRCIDSVFANATYLGKQAAHQSKEGSHAGFRLGRLVSTQYWPLLTLITLIANHISSVTITSIMRATTLSFSTKSPDPTCKFSAGSVQVAVLESNAAV